MGTSENLAVKIVVQCPKVSFKLIQEAHYGVLFNNMK